MYDATKYQDQSHLFITKIYSGTSVLLLQKYYQLSGIRCIIFCMK